MSHALPEEKITARVKQLQQLREAAEAVLADAELMAEGSLYHCSTEPMYRLMEAVARVEKSE